MNLLSVKQFSILGRCAGTPYALACANHFKDRVSRVGIVSGIPRAQDIVDQSDSPMLLKSALGILKKSPNMSAHLYKILLKDGIEPSFKRLVSSSTGALILTALDRSWYQETSIFEHTLSNMDRALKQGVSACINKLRPLFSSWNFDAGGNHIEHIFWHGENDPVISTPMINKLAAEFKNHHIEILPKESHLLFERHFEKIYVALATK